MRLLFLGASNTDCGHCFTPDNLGSGYVKMTAQALAASSCYCGAAFRTDGSGLDRYSLPQIINGGTDGFTFPRIYEKWKRMYAGQHFDLVSVLGGINEIGAVMDSPLTETQADELLFASGRALGMLLEELTAAQVSQILVPEPFLFPYPAHLQTWMARLDQMRQIIRSAVRQARSSSRISDLFRDCPISQMSGPSQGNSALQMSNLFRDNSALQMSGLCPGNTPQRADIRIVPLQPALDAYAAVHGYRSISPDGIHLTEQGHRIVARLLLEIITGGS